MPAEIRKDHLALKYHLLEAMIGTAVEPPVAKFRVSEALRRFRKQLRVSPFGRSHVSRALREMAEEGLVVAKKDKRGPYWEAAGAGREAYTRYKEVVALWRLEKRFGEKLELKTVNRISPRLPRQDKFHMPAVSNVKLPFEYKPLRHRFEEDMEIRVWEVSLLTRARVTE